MIDDTYALRQAQQRADHAEAQVVKLKKQLRALKTAVSSLLGKGCDATTCGLRYHTDCYGAPAIRLYRLLGRRVKVDE